MTKLNEMKPGTMHNASWNAGHHARDAEVATLTAERDQARVESRLAVAVALENAATILTDGDYCRVVDHGQDVCHCKEIRRDLRALILAADANLLAEHDRQVRLEEAEWFRENAGCRIEAEKRLANLRAKESAE